MDALEGFIVTMIAVCLGLGGLVLGGRSVENTVEKDCQQMGKTRINSAVYTCAKDK